ncbi:unnamed protein product [Rotaria sp. Silwood1]|nr:unnamed protein product [Rotaria sp. Silwood1]
MAKDKVEIRLQKLLNNELSSSSNDKNQVISAYDSLISILQTPETRKQLHGYHELLFECISQIILTSSNQFFHDDQLCFLLELASNACVLSMSQNQIIDSWLQNVEERTFEKPDKYEDDDDDDDLYEDATDSEEQEDENITKIQDNNKKSNRNANNQGQQRHVFTDDASRHGSNTMSSKEKSRPLTKQISNQHNIHVTHSHDNQPDFRNSERNSINKTSTQGNNNRKPRDNEYTNNPRKGSDTGTNKGRRAPPFNNKYGVDLQLYDCYICGEYGHVQYDCPMKQVNSKVLCRNRVRTDLTNKNEQNQSKSSASISSIEKNLTEKDQNRIQQVYNQLSKVINSSQTIEEQNNAFDLFLSLIQQLEKQHGENLSKIFNEKESIFYSLFCHVAQNDFLFTNDQYLKLYHLKNILLPQKYHLLNEDRSIFCRQRILIPLIKIREHINNVTQIQQTIFNDFQEYIIRSTSPISIVLFNLITDILKSNMYIDKKSIEYLTKNILFDLKKNIFSNEQLNELHICFDIRIKRFERNHQKQIWKERLILFKNNQLLIDLNQWILEFEQILNTNFNEDIKSEKIVVENAMWYFAVLLMTSSGHLNKDQYEYILKAAIQSSLFNSIQKFYFQYYLNHKQAPITIYELNQIKIKLESHNIDDKKLAYKQIKMILDRQKPELNDEQIEQLSSVNHIVTGTNDQSRKPEDIIPIIDNHVLSRLISLVEMVCSDTNTFSTEQLKELLDKFLHQSTIVRPLSNIDQQHLTSFYSRPISLNELKTYCLSTKLDLNDFLSLLKHRPLMNNNEVYDYFTQTIINIFENRQKYSNEQCQELKNFLEKKTLGKIRYRLINEAYEKFRLNKKILPTIDRTILNQLLNNILLQDYQAHLEFFNLLEEISQVMDFNEITIDFEINRCLLSTIILVIIDANYSNFICFHQRLKILIEKQTKFFSLLLTEQQYKLILSRLTSISNIDQLINLIKTNLNKENFLNLIHFIQNELNDKNDFEKLINFILYTFDNEFLSIEQTLEISNLIFQHKKLNNKTYKNILRFLIDLLQLNIHSSPKIFLNLIDNNQENDQIINQITMILKVQNGKYAIEDWKKIMIQLLKILFNRQHNYEKLKDIAQQSAMFQQSIYKQQLESCWKKTSDNQSDENKSISAIPKDNNKNDHSAAHREMFHYLESNDASKNSLVVQQLRTYLLNEQLPSEILLPKFIQALQIILRNSQKFTDISLGEWATLIAKNRGKIFINDAQCDQLLMDILLVHLKMPTDTLNSFNRLIQSKKAYERQNGLQKLILLLKNTQINNEKSNIKNLPTISNEFYNAITQILFDQKFNDHQVRQCITAAKNSWLLNSDHREKLNNI